MGNGVRKRHLPSLIPKGENPNVSAHHKPIINQSKDMGRKRKYKTPEEAEEAYRKGDREYQQKKRAMGLVDKTEEYRIWRKKNPLGANAHSKLNIAIKNGKIKRSACVVCGRKNAYGHHQDYKKPYDVIWLCPIHHKLIHQNGK